MHIRIVAPLIAVLTLAAPAPAEHPSTVAARETLRLYLDGRYADFVAAGTDELQAKFPAAQAEMVAKQLEAQFGQYQHEQSVEHFVVEGMDLNRFALRYDKAVLRLQLTLDSQGKLAGFFITGVEAADPAPLPPYADPRKYTETPITVQTGLFELPGTLTLPVDAGKCPAVVLVHGSGPHDQDETVLGNKPFRDLAAGLATHGVAVLRYEKRTHKYGSQMKAEGVTFEAETIDDALSAAALLRTRPEIDPQRVFVAGHSLGGTAGPFIAQRDDKLAGLIILAGTPRSLLDLIVEQMEYIANLDREPTAEDKSQIEEVKQSVAAIRAGTAGEADVPLPGAPLKYWQQMENLPTLATAQQLELPILIVQFGRDYQVTRKCFEAWRAGLKDRGNVKFKVYDDLNHLMIKGAGPSSPQEYGTAGNVDEALVQDLAAWMKKL
jgi:dienelactone hydrolase